MLGRIKTINAGPVLGSHIIALSHPLGRVVAFEERFEKLLIGNFVWLEDDKHNFVVACISRANLFICGVGRKSSRVADGGNPDPATELPELALSAPETTQSEDGRLRPFWIRAFERPAENMVLQSRWDRVGASR